VAGLGREPPERNSLHLRARVCLRWASASRSRPDMTTERMTSPMLSRPHHALDFVDDAPAAHRLACRGQRRKPRGVAHRASLRPQTPQRLQSSCKKNPATPTRNLGVDRQLSTLTKPGQTIPIDFGAETISPKVIVTAKE
jgi:hypothetical protein